MRFFILTLLFIIWVVAGSSAQPQYFTPVHIAEVMVEGTVIDHPFTGGMEAPQFRPFTLNDDGYQDLLIFDRVGAKLLPFVALPNTDGSIDYQYAPEFEASLPTGLNQLLLVQDLNCDGWDDIVSTRIATTAADVMLIAYLREPGFPVQFSAGQPLMQMTNNGSLTTLNIHAYDVPVLKDLSGDDRADLLYIPIGGTHLEYYQRTGDCDDFTFALTDSCWGNASYTIDADFELQACEPGFRAQGCAGSVMLCNDYDEDGDQDLLFSGLYDEHILQLENAGDLTNADLISQDIEWINDGMGLTRFPSPFFVPYSNGQRADLIVATNLITGQGYSSFNDKVLRFTKNNESDNWVLAEDQFMLGQMIDLGFRSNIVLQDVNKDGLLDLLLGYNDRHPTFSYTAAIALFLNTGTADHPAFELDTRDWMGLSAFNFKSIAPAFGDFNGDGQDDLVIGLENGDLQLFYRQGDVYLLADGAPLQELSLNGLARPVVVDYDRDGLLDLICGTRNGTISYIQNTGSPQAPSFALVTDTLGGIAPTEGFYQECSVALSPKDTPEDGYWLYYGNRQGEIGLYELYDQATAQLLHDALPEVDLGERISIQLADLNNNGLPELWGGSARGGVEVFEAQLTNAIRETSTPKRLSIFPNPAHDKAWLELPAGFEGGFLHLYNATGQQMSPQYIPPVTQLLPLPISTLPQGLYLYQIKTKNEQYTGRLVVNH